MHFFPEIPALDGLYKRDRLYFILAYANRQSYTQFKKQNQPTNQKTNKPTVLAFT